MLANVIKALKHIEENSLEAYLGDGLFEKYKIKKGSTLNVAEISQINTLKFTLPNDYIEFLIGYGNGVSFFEIGGCCIYSLEEAIKFSKIQVNEVENTPLLYVANVCEDDVLITCVSTGEIVYVQEEGIETPISLKMGFTEFIERLLQSNCLKFWEMNICLD